jgi:O-antigen ligase
LQQLTLFLIAMQPGLLISWYAVRNNWSGAVNFDENYWIGIYFNRNSLAPPAALGLLAAGALAWILINRKPKYWFLSTVILVDVMILDLGLLIRSKSSTSLGAIAVFIFVWGFWTAIRWSQRRRISLSKTQLAEIVYPSFLFLVTVGTWLTLKFHATFLGLFRVNSNFSERIILWKFSWGGFKSHMLAGWGWMAAWQTPLFYKQEMYFYQEFQWVIATGNKWSHSAVMDVLLGGGVVGAGLLILAIVWSGARQLDRVFTQTAGQWTFAATWFVITASTQESFIVGNHFLWLLLVASMAGSRNEPTRI